jgi:hypothetical protein
VQVVLDLLAVVRGLELGQRRRALDFVFVCVFLFVFGGCLMVFDWGIFQRVVLFVFSAAARPPSKTQHSLPPPSTNHPHHPH